MRRRVRGSGIRDGCDRGGYGRGGGTVARQRDDGKRIGGARRSDGERAPEAKAAAARLLRTWRHNNAQRCGTTTTVPPRLSVSGAHLLSQLGCMLLTWNDVV